MENTTIWYKVSDFIKALPSLIMDTFFWLLFSFGIIFVNIFIIMGMKSISFNKVIERFDIALCILTTVVCFLVGIIYLMYLSEKKRRFVFAWSIVFAAIAACLSIILMIQIELNTSFFKKGYVKTGLYITFIFSIILALISKYDETNMRDRTYGAESREIDEITIGGKEFKL
ncbi:hypothetical protein [Fictibacillus terranigra]|uniref:Uncharacterized protein n=1 Tax=Fictibacillus terranigra TaxID=3058424 RepID=A0ABT8EAH6_9BACL|nr:hypothetical protein [Fictibacillus sp. CENA-BCM004]MDN4074924.1 hypothetical protein [Fictibacillus sp. CENA-BCM004]